MNDTTTTPGHCIGHRPVSMIYEYGAPGSPPEQTISASGWTLSARTRPSRRILRTIAVAASVSADGTRDFKGLR
jgi:hypothetical protein